MKIGHKKSRPGMGRLLLNQWRRGRDSNPRSLATYTLSRRAPSTTRTPLLLLTRGPIERRILYPLGAPFASFFNVLAAKIYSEHGTDTAHYASQ